MRQIELDIGKGPWTVKATAVGDTGVLYKFDKAGKTYYVTPAPYRSIYSDDPGWRLVGDPEESRRAQSARLRTRREPEERNALDRQVWEVLKEYGTRGIGSTDLAYDIFENRRPAVAIYTRAKQVSAIEAALRRLEKRKLVTQFYGAGRRKAEIKVYEAIGHWTDVDPAGDWEDEISDVVSVDRHSDGYTVILDDGSSLRVHTRDQVRAIAEAAKGLSKRSSTGETMAERIRPMIWPPYPKFIDVYFAAGDGRLTEASARAAVTQALKPVEGSIFYRSLMETSIKHLTRYAGAARYYGETRDPPRDPEGVDSFADREMEWSKKGWEQDAWMWWHAFERA